MDEKTQGQVQSYIDKIEELFKHPALKIQRNYDARFTTIRTRETPIGNFISEVACNWAGFDVSLVQSGHIRCDKILEAGILLKKEVFQILPIVDSFCGIEITGEQLLQA